MLAEGGAGESREAGLWGIDSEGASLRDVFMTGGGISVTDCVAAGIGADL